MNSILHPLTRFMIPAFCGMFSMSASAATIINSTTNNGSFELGSGTGIGSTINLWQPAFGADQVQRINNNASLGTYSAVVGYADDTGQDTTTGLLLNTGHTVGMGETYNLSFDWIPLLSWTATDQMLWRLFTTNDDTTAGTISVIVGGTVTGFANGAGYQFNLGGNGIGTVAPANVGQKLWIEFSENNAVPTGREFSRVDNVVLTSIPEPSSAILLLSGLAGLVLLRRR